MSNTIRKLCEQGQSIWCDNLSRAIIDGGELQRLIDLGIVGVTTNPTIFMKSISGSSDYDARIESLVDGGADTMALYEGLVLADVADAADLFRPVFERTAGVDGFVSIEVNPALAYDTKGTIEEARRLFAELNRSNIFIKVPATEEGIPAVETLIGEGINVNVTLIFSIAMYEKVMQAYLKGVKRLIDGGGDPSGVASVASFFVSRIDTLVDKQLSQKKASGEAVDGLFGRAAVANARLAYARFEEVFDGNGDFGALVSKGARLQRPLWASTSTKNPDYKPTLYVDELVGPDTVNTLPPATIEATLNGGAAEVSIRRDLEGARALFQQLAELGIHEREVTGKLLVDGVKAFANSFDELIASLAGKREQLRTSGRV